MLLIDSFVFPVLQKVISSGKTGKVNPSWEVLALPNMMMMCTWCEPDVCNDDVMMMMWAWCVRWYENTSRKAAFTHNSDSRSLQAVQIPPPENRDNRENCDGDCSIAFFAMNFNRGDFWLWLLPVASEHLRLWWGKETMETAFWAENMWFETFYGERLPCFQVFDLFQKIKIQRGILLQSFNFIWSFQNLTNPFPDF